MHMVHSYKICLLNVSLQVCIFVCSSLRVTNKEAIQIWQLLYDYHWTEPILAKINHCQYYREEGLSRMATLDITIWADDESRDHTLAYLPTG